MSSGGEAQHSLEADSSDPTKKTKKDRLNLESFLGKAKIGSWASLVDTLGDDLDQQESPIEASLNMQSLSISSSRANPPALELPPSKVDSYSGYGGHNQRKGKGNDQTMKSPQMQGKKGGQGSRSFGSEGSSLSYITVSGLPQNIRVSEVVTWLLDAGAKVPKEDINIWPSSRDSTFDCYILIRDQRSHQTIQQHARAEKLSPGARMDVSYDRPSDFQDKPSPVNHHKPTNTNTRHRENPPLRENHGHNHGQDFNSSHGRQGRGRRNPFGDSQADTPTAFSPRETWQSSSESNSGRSETSGRPKLNLLPRSVDAPLGGISDAYSNKPTPFAGAKPIAAATSDENPTSAPQAEKPPQSPARQTNTHVTVLSPRAKHANTNSNTGSNSRKGGSGRTENLEVFIRITPTPSPSASPALQPVAGASEHSESA